MIPIPLQPVALYTVAIAKILIIIGDEKGDPSPVHILNIISKTHIRLNKFLILETLILTS